MPAQPPIPPAARSPFGPEGEPKILHDVSHRVRHAAERAGREAGPVPGASVLIPLAKVAAAAVVGYVLGAIVHRRAPAPARPEPVAAFHPARPGQSGIRFR